jgi:hypothetical protein
MLAGYHKRMTTTIYNEKVLRDFSGFPNYSGVDADVALRLCHRAWPTGAPAR